LYSKKASSPTKMAELMGLGIPLVCNAGVGDVESVLRSGGNGLIINSLSKEEMSRSIAQIDELLKANRNNNIHCARAMFSLEEGVRRYEKIYARLHS
jgi:glycosyltransferase involved in cell wall biosynthesis